MERVIIICACLVFASCASTPAPSVSATQTEIATTGATLTGDIATVKEITDKAKTTGEISKQDLPVVIKYVDKSAEEVKTLNALIAKHTGELVEQSKVIGQLQVEVTKYKPYRERFFVLAIICVLIIAGFVALKLRKVL